MENNSIYLDNNATTFMPNAVLKEYIGWANKGNPSAGYAGACKDKINELRAILAKLCGISPATHNIIITSGASESNAHIIQATIAGYTYAMDGRPPHIISSNIEHKSILMCLEQMKVLGRATVSFAQCDDFGFVTPEAIEPLIRENTALITIMAANNETGAINDTGAIAALAHKYNIPLHCDYTQKFGKNPPSEPIDAFSLSFHKFHGPPGIGALVIKKDFYEGLHLCPLIFGTQNNELRGGTENISAVAAAVAALKYTFVDRNKKNTALEEKKKYMIIDLAKKIKCISLSQYERAPTANSSPRLLFISGTGENYLSSTLLISVVWARPVCNVELKKQLERDGVIVGIGSACNTDSKNASHVVSALNVDNTIKRGILRISMSDNTTVDEIKKFNDILISRINQR